MSKSSEVEQLRTQVIVKLTLLVGACRTASIKKKQIEESLERFIGELEAQDKKCTADRKTHCKCACSTCAFCGKEKTG